MNKIITQDSNGNRNVEVIPEGSEDFHINIKLKEIDMKLDKLIEMVGTKWEK